MIKKLSAVLLAALLCFATGCGSKNVPAASQNEETDSASSSTTNRVSVVTTIFPPYDFARQITADAADLTMLLPPASESHSFEPTPQDIINIQNCDVFIYGGGESDAWVDGILESIDTTNITVLSMMDVVDVVEEETKEGMTLEPHDHDDEEQEYDEHVWTSPQNAKRITTTIADTLSKIDAKNADFYQSNAKEYLAKLDALDAEFSAIVANATHKTMIFGDRFPFRYFVDTYGLDYFAAFPGCSNETEANAQTVAFLINKVREEEIPVVFYIELSNQKMADTICSETGAKKMLFHSVHNLTKEEFENGANYLALMQQNAAALKEALG